MPDQVPVNLADGAVVAALAAPDNVNPVPPACVALVVSSFCLCHLGLLHMSPVDRAGPVSEISPHSYFL